MCFCFFTGRERLSVSYDRSGFIDGDLVLLPELKPTWRPLPKSTKDSENRQIFCRRARPSVRVTHANAPHLSKSGLKPKSGAVPYIYSILHGALGHLNTAFLPPKYGQPAQHHTHVSMGQFCTFQSQRDR